MTFVNLSGLNVGLNTYPLRRRHLNFACINSPMLSPSMTFLFIRQIAVLTSHLLTRYVAGYLLSANLKWLVSVASTRTCMNVVCKQVCARIMSFPLESRAECIVFGSRFCHSCTTRTFQQLFFKLVKCRLPPIIVPSKEEKCIPFAVFSKLGFMTWYSCVNIDDIYIYINNYFSNDIGTITRRRLVLTTQNGKAFQGQL